MGGHKVYIGEDSAPVILNIKYSVSEDEAAVEIQKTFRKNTTLGEMKVRVFKIFTLFEGTLFFVVISLLGLSTRFDLGRERR